MPVMIHRAILGSIERMLAVLTEHWAGRVAILVQSSTGNCNSREVGTNQEYY